MYVKVRVAAGAKKEELKEMSKDYLVIAVREPAERNLANTRVIILVARHFGVPTNRVRIISGHQSPSKMFSVECKD
jgi:uncharacterized protein YggU (UPF0235/DUF167 family)